MSKAPKCRFCGAVEENHNERGCWPERQVRQSRTPEWRVEDVPIKELNVPVNVPVTSPNVPVTSDVPVTPKQVSGTSKGGQPRKNICQLPDHDERGASKCKLCASAKKKAVRG